MAVYKKGIDLMKFIPLIVFVVFIVSCTTDNNSTSVDSNHDASKTAEEQKSSGELEQAIRLAKENQDFRFMVTSGRSMSIPGLKSEQYQSMVELCGKKYSPEVVDVITSEAQRAERKALIEFMRQYNKQIIKLCQENTSK